MIESATDDRLSHLAGEVARRLTARGHLLVTAESCTGGWLGKLCTDLPGSSNWYSGGAVVYSNALKQTLLGVRVETLAAEGAVSEAVVGEMALGALQRLGGDIVVAISGIAGPDGGTQDKPVGTVWIAWAHRAGGGKPLRAAGLWLPGERDAVRRQALAAALQGLLEG
jgi:nicotinamide-nucleotide amidase